MNQELISEAKIRFNDCDPIGHLNNIKYLEYMLNAREDHVQDYYGFSYEDYVQKTGCTWITVQNEIAYLREVRYNTKVLITSKTIEVKDRITKLELLMKSQDGKTVHAVFWMTIIYFDLKTRRSTVQPEDIQNLFKQTLVELDTILFQERAEYFRKLNKAE